MFPTDQEPERRARIRARLNQLGEGPAAVFHDLCLLLDKDLGLEARPMLVSHLVRELESSVREVLLPRQASTADQEPEPVPAEHPVVAALRLVGDEVLRALGLKPAPEAGAESEPEEAGAGTTHRREIAEILDALGIDPAGPVGTAWRKVAQEQARLAHRSNLAAPRLREDREWAWRRGRGAGGVRRR